ncbi:hypothetical protein [Paenibacillus sp. Marseille-Q4541]|uniref:hypothetical protein n=1 Tax=Paenibacillus sp. Marseille-Q4541 TaxID=2831522 RepID=UPI001BA904BB|nr:hypothetical protein [Paenibacillus sp. Marseille-Q4541]
MKMTTSERWALYPMHLIFMFLIHFSFGIMNLLMSVTYGEHSIWSYIIFILFLQTWYLYSYSVKKRWVDFMIINSIYWLGGLAILFISYEINSSSSISFILLLPFYGTLLGFGPLFVNTSYETAGLLTSNLLCYVFIMLCTLFVGKRSQQHKNRM